MWLLEKISLWTIPVLLLVIPLYGYLRGVKVYEAFTEGAKEGFETAVRIIPFLVAILVAIGIFRASGAMDLVKSYIGPLTSAIGLPADFLPLAIMKSLSGGGSTGLMTDLIKSYGPDTWQAKLAAVINAASDTTFYVIAVYFGSVSIKKSRHAAAAGLIADFTSIVMAVIMVRWMFVR